MPEKLRGKSNTLTPNLRFAGPQAMARCKKVWKQLFELLYEHSITAESVSEFEWRVDADQARVQLVPLPVDEAAAGDLWTRPPVFEFGVDEFLPHITKLNGPKNVTARAKLHQQFRDWIADAVIEGFQSEPVQIEYSWFNEEDHPFSTSITLTADRKTKKPILLWSNTRTFRPRPKQKAAKRKLVTPRPDYFRGGWRRFYFDDGETRRFWYIRSKGATQEIAQGDLGTDGKSTTKKRKSPKLAREAVQQAVDAKLAEGWIEYAPEDIQYVTKHRFAISRIKKELAEYENTRGFRLPEEYRRHVLTVNGGGLNDYDRRIKAFVSVPGHPDWDKVEVYSILGFATRYDHQSVVGTSWGEIGPHGHVQFARSPTATIMMDQQGSVYAQNMGGVTVQDYDDDGNLYLERFPAWPVAHCFDEFLTRIIRFPNDVSSAGKAKTPEQDQAKLDERFDSARKAAAAAPFRRFFFDDGKHHKFWNIETKGKQFTTYYGRSGSQPSESTKKFQTANAAQTASEKIIAQKVKKGYHEVLPGALRVERPKEFKRATPAAVRKLEQELGAKLPDEYRRFLETQNGGTLTPGYIAIPEVRYGPSIVDIPYLLGLYPDHNDPRSLHHGMTIASRLLPPGHLVVAVGSDLYTVSLTSKPGCVWYWDHESDDVEYDMSEAANDRFRPSAARLLANSFEEFLTRIAMYREE